MRTFTYATALTVLGLSTGSSAAFPAPRLGDLPQALPIERVASWRYHDNCGWQGGRWVVDLGAGRLVLCRPIRPDRSYDWRRERNREGWYNRRSRTWYFDKW